MSKSVKDKYQPAEATVNLVQGILECETPCHSLHTETKQTNHMYTVSKEQLLAQHGNIKCQESKTIQKMGEGNVIDCLFYTLLGGEGFQI